MAYGIDQVDPVSAGGSLRRSYPQGYEGSGASGTGTTKFEFVVNLKTASAVGHHRTDST
jgi:hypothetical protein